MTRHHLLVPRGSRNVTTAACAFVLCLLHAVFALPTTARDHTEADLNSDRNRALLGARDAAAAAERMKADAAQRLPALDAEATAARDTITQLQKDLLAASAKDDAAGIAVARARLAARQAEQEAAEGEKALLQKQVEEAERDRDVWRRRTATIELALRQDMKVMLAGPADIADRDKRVDAAVRDADNQRAQIRKYASRRISATVELSDLRYHQSALAGLQRPSDPKEVQEAREAESRALARLAHQQTQWVCLNKSLEDRARRNLAFARTDYLVNVSYAEALSRKAGLQRAAEARALADKAESQLAIVRGAQAATQKQAEAGQAQAAAEVEAALKRLGDPQAADLDQARQAYSAAVTRRDRWEAENDCWKEFLALQKAVAAYAREKADRARDLAGDRGLVELTQDERLLRESLETSEQYVRSFQRMVGKADDQIASACRVLGLEPRQVEERAAALRKGLPDTAAEPLPFMPEPLVRQMTIASEGLEDGDTAATLVARMAQRELLKARAAISQRWLDHTHECIRTLQSMSGARLWRRHDPRLNETTLMEAGALAGAIVSDATYAWDGIRLKFHGCPSIPSRKRLMQGALLVLILWAAARLAARRIPTSGRPGWLAARLVTAVPPLAVAGWLAIRLGHGNLAFLWAGHACLAFAAWRLVRALMLAFSAKHRPPPPATAGGALFVAVNAIALWTALLYPFHHLAHQGANPQDVQAVIHQFWLLGICFAGFRLALHPAFMGRLLSRRSRHRGLRYLGTSVAIACLAAAVLAALPYLAGLDNLGDTVLLTVEASFVVLIAALAGTAAAGWLIRRWAPSSRVTVWVRPLQSVITVAALAAVAGIWWRLLNQVVLAPNAPPPVQELVRAVARAGQAALHVWHRELTGGMTVSSLARGILVFALSFWVSRVVRRVFLERVLARTPMDEATRLTFAAILGYLVILLGFLIGLNVAGSSLQNLALLAGAITVGLGFGLQNVINNFVSSLLIHFGRTIRVGDYIDAAGTRGTVREIGLRNTVIATDDGITVLVPNGSFISANIVNWTNPTRRTRLHVPVSVTRQADLGAVAELAAGVARNHPLVIREPVPTFEVRSVTAAQVTAELLVWTEKPERLASIVGELSLALDRALRDRGFMA